MIIARAPVRPPVQAVESVDGCAVALDVYRDRLANMPPNRVVAIVGPAKSGRSTALAHAATLCENPENVAFLDMPNVADVEHELAQGRRVVYASESPLGVAVRCTEVFRLAPWETDQWVEYLQSRHPGACRSVMKRLMTARLRRMPAALWTLVLDRLAENEELRTESQAIAALLEDAMDGSARLRAGLGCLRSQANVRRMHPLLGFSECRATLATAVVVRSVRELKGRRTAQDRPRLPRVAQQEIIRNCADIARTDAEFAAGLDELMGSAKAEHQASALTILRAAEIDWRPRGDEVPTIAGARAPGLKWSELNLRRLRASAAMLCGSDFSNADLEGADFHNSDLSTALLGRANLSGAYLSNADLAGADLLGAKMLRTRLLGAKLTAAVLDGVLAIESVFDGATLAAASLHAADLTRSRFGQCNMEETDLRKAILCGVSMSGVDLRRSELRGSVWSGAKLRQCSLENIAMEMAEFERAQLSGCDLSGSRMPNGRFEGASLRSCGLAEIDWSGADLKNADLRGSTFHMGSSRSGLVGAGTILPACEGSKTGFYGDDFCDQTHVAPEEIRKANLCGANLVGANVEGVDFYLVDLRRARYSPGQAEWFRACGAILRTPRRRR